MDLEQTIRDRLSVLEPQAVEIQDESHRHAGHAGARESGGGHFAVTVVSKRFEGQQPQARHRMVYETVSDLIPARIHALSIRAYTPAERTASGQ
jgi:BolA family transcriptional regulator, general stress-responsive regulator